MKHNKRSKGEEGFTLIELMVVIVIIGLLAGAVVVRYVKYLEEAKITATRAKIRTLKDLITIYKITGRKYPADIMDLVPEYVEDATTMKDGWGNEIKYIVPGENGPFDLVSGGPDEDYNTDEDNINSWELGKTNEE